MWLKEEEMKINEHDLRMQFISETKNCNLIAILGIFNFMCSTIPALINSIKEIKMDTFVVCLFANIQEREKYRN